MYLRNCSAQLKLRRAIFWHTRLSTTSPDHIIDWVGRRFLYFCDFTFTFIFKFFQFSIQQIHSVKGQLLVTKSILIMLTSYSIFCHKTDCFKCWANHLDATVQQLGVKQPSFCEKYWDPEVIFVNAITASGVIFFQKQRNLQYK